MNKKVLRTISFMLLLMCSLTGCTTSKENSNSELIDLNELRIEDSNELIQEVNGINNLSISDDTMVIVPKTSHMYEYTTSLPQKVDITDYDLGFKSIFKYLFPDHNIDEKYLLYMGGSSKLEYDDNGDILINFNHVNEWWDNIISGEEGRISYLYDETWNMDKIHYNNEVCLEIGNPIGCGYAVINKGVTVKECGHKVYDDKLKQERCPVLESYDPSEWLEYVATYPPNSSTSYSLINGEISICEAVEFFEKYINSLPYPSDYNSSTKVIEVDVYKLSESTYGYYFLTTMEYEGIYFDHMRSGVEHSEFNDYISLGGNAFMALKDDIDIVYGYYRKQNIDSATEYNKVVTIPTALNCISTKLSNNVIFNVKKIEIVYTQKTFKDANGYIDLESYTSFVSPAWKISLYNPNDGYEYICYVDAKNGENFRYYKTPANMEMIS